MLVARDNATLWRSTQDPGSIYSETIRAIRPIPGRAESSEDKTKLGQEEGNEHCFFFGGGIKSEVRNG